MQQVSIIGGSYCRGRAGWHLASNGYRELCNCKACVSIATDVEPLTRFASLDMRSPKLNREVRA